MESEEKIDWVDRDIKSGLFQQKLGIKLRPKEEILAEMEAEEKKNK